MRSSYLVFGSPVIEEEEIAEVVSVMRSGWIGTGPRVQRFEDDFKNYIGVKHAVAVASCTAGLHLSVVVLGIGPGDEVLVPAVTFAASANAVIHAGAVPVFVDVHPFTFTIDIEDAERKITPRTKAIIPVHFAGRPCDIDGIEFLAEKYGLKIIHDTAHAVETEWNGKKIGTFRDLASYSFYVTKNITTAEGGIVTTNDDAIANQLKVYALHGMSKDAWKRFSDDGYKHYEIIFPGFKYNMTDIQAAIGIEQLKKIDRFAERRIALWKRYSEALSDLPLFLPPPPEPNTRNALHLYILLVDTQRTTVTRDEALSALHKLNIGTGVHYTALHLHPYYRSRFGFNHGDFPNAEFISERTFSIPFSAKLSDQDANDVIEALHTVFA